MLRARRLVALIDPVEAQLLSQLVAQIGALLDSTRDATPDAPRDAALLRLLPDAYPGDREASAEFRRYTAAGLADKKVRNAHLVARDVAPAAASVDATELSLDHESVQAWLRSLTDVRLVLANRLGIETDDAATAFETEGEQMLHDVYDWVGWVQDSLVHALEGASSEADAEPDAASDAGPDAESDTESNTGGRAT